MSIDSMYVYNIIEVNYTTIGGIEKNRSGVPGILKETELV